MIKNQNNTCLYPQLCTMYIQHVIKLCGVCVTRKKIIFHAHVSDKTDIHRCIHTYTSMKKFISIGHRLWTRQVVLGLDSQRAPWCTGYSKSTWRKLKSLAFPLTLVGRNIVVSYSRPVIRHVGCSSCSSGLVDMTALHFIFDSVIKC